MKRFAFDLLLLSLFVISPAFIQAQPSKNELLPIQRLEKLLRDLETIETDGRRILEHQDTTIAEIKNLKVWTRKQ
jgi:hypothetical protein